MASCVAAHNWDLSVYEANCFSLWHCTNCDAVRLRGIPENTDLEFINEKDYREYVNSIGR